jgi:hypothetical protein
MLWIIAPSSDGSCITRLVSRKPFEETSEVRISDDLENLYRETLGAVTQHKGEGHD